MTNQKERGANAGSNGVSGHGATVNANENTAATDSGYYQRHIFFCINKRANGEAACADGFAEKAFDFCKSQVRAAGINGKGQVRVNKAGCLDRCAGGPVAVVYPEAVWYSFVDESDVAEIVASHLVQGVVVDRLRLPDDVGR